MLRKCLGRKNLELFFKIAPRRIANPSSSAVLPNLFVTADRSVLDNFTAARCQAQFLTSRYLRMRRVIFNTSKTLRKLIIEAQGLVFRYVVG